MKISIACATALIGPLVGSLLMILPAKAQDASSLFGDIDVSPLVEAGFGQLNVGDIELNGPSLSAGVLARMGVTNKVNVFGGLTAGIQAGKHTETINGLYTFPGLEATDTIEGGFNLAARMGAEVEATDRITVAGYGLLGAQQVRHTSTRWDEAAFWQEFNDKGFASPGDFMFDTKSSQVSMIYGVGGSVGYKFNKSLSAYAGGQWFTGSNDISGWKINGGLTFKFN